MEMVSHFHSAFRTIYSPFVISGTKGKKCFTSFLFHRPCLRQIMHFEGLEWWLSKTVMWPALVHMQTVLYRFLILDGAAYGISHPDGNYCSCYRSANRIKLKTVQIWIIFVFAESFPLMRFAPLQCYLMIDDHHPFCYVDNHSPVGPYTRTQIFSAVLFPRYSCV